MDESARLDPHAQTVGGSKAILLTSAQFNVATCEVEITFPASSSTNRAAFVFAHDGTNNYYAVALDRTAAKIASHQIISGSWGSALASATATWIKDLPITPEKILNAMREEG